MLVQLVKAKEKNVYLYCLPAVLHVPFILIVRARTFLSSAFRERPSIPIVPEEDGVRAAASGREKKEKTTNCCNQRLFTRTKRQNGAFCLFLLRLFQLKKKKNLYMNFSKKRTKLSRLASFQPTNYIVDGLESTPVTRATEKMTVCVFVYVVWQKGDRRAY